MRKNKKAAMAAAIIAGALLLTSCTGDDTSRGNDAEVEERDRDRERDRERDRDRDRDREETSPSPEPSGDDDEPGFPGDDGLDPTGRDGRDDPPSRDGGDGLEGFGDLDGLGDYEAPDYNATVPLPDGFPSGVPLVDGNIFQVEHTDGEILNMYTVSINAPGNFAQVEADAANLLTGAGFVPQEDDSLSGFGSDMEGFSMQAYTGTGDINTVYLSLVDMDGLGFTLVVYSVDNSDWDFDW